MKPIFTLTRMIVILLGMVCFHTYAIEPMLVENKVQTDLETLLSRLFEKSEFLVQANVEINSRTERKLVEGETLQLPLMDVEETSIPTMPGFLPDPSFRKKKDATPQQRQVYRFVETPELRWVKVYVNFHDKLQQNMVNQAKSLIQSYLRTNYPEKSVVTFSQLPMLDAEKEQIAKKEREKEKEKEKALPPPLEEKKPTLDETMWGYAKWASLLLLLLITLLLMLRKQNAQMQGFPHPYLPGPFGSNLASLLGSGEGKKAKSESSKEAKKGATSSGAAVSVEGDTAQIARKKFIARLLNRSDAFRIYYQKLPDEKKNELWGVLKGPAFDSYMEGLSIPKPKDEPAEITDSSEKIAHFEKQFEEFTDAKTWQDGQFFGFLQRMNNQQLITLVNHEDPLAVCLMLRFMKAQQSAFVLDAIPPEKRLQVLSQVPQLKTIGFNEILEMEREVRKAIETLPMYFFGSPKEDIDFWGNVLSESEKQDQILQDLERTQPEIYPNLKKFKFRLEDAASLPDTLLARVLGEADNEELALALAGCQKDVCEVLLDAVSPRRREILANQIEPMRNAPKEQIASARTTLTKRFREVLT